MARRASTRFWRTRTHRTSHFGSVRAGFNDEEHGASARVIGSRSLAASVLNVGSGRTWPLGERGGARGAGRRRTSTRPATTCGGREKRAGGSRKSPTRLVVDAMGNASPVARQCRREAMMARTAAVGHLLCRWDLCGNQPVRRVRRQFFTKSFLGDDAAVLAPSSGEEPASPRHRAGVASMAWRTATIQRERP